MKKLLATAILVSAAGSAALAGGLLTNTNQSVHFLRNPARDASTEIDAAYTNPAGVTLLSDGFHLSLTNQSVFQTRTINSTFAPFAGYGGSATKEFKGEAAAPVVPSFQFVYKKEKWAVSGGFAITGGGGKATFNHGLASFEAPLSLLPISLNAMLPTTKYSVDGYMEGKQFIFGLQLNGSYKISDNFSAALGLRLNMVSNGYTGHLKNIMINPKHPALNPNADMISATSFFTTIGSTTNAAKTKDAFLDCTQNGWGVTPIIGFNYHYEKLNIGMKYEFNTSLNVENKTKIDDTGKFTDGVNTPHDIPALYTVGASYEVCSHFKLSGGYHHFFDSDAKMSNDKQQYIDGGVNEYLLGAEFKINNQFMLSAGGQITRTGVKDDYQTDMSYSLNSYSIGFGGAVNISPKLRLNVAYFFTNYDNWTKVSSNYNGLGLTGTDVMGRTNKVFGIGVDYKF